MTQVSNDRQPVPVYSDLEISRHQIQTMDILLAMAEEAQATAECFTLFMRNEDARMDFSYKSAHVGFQDRFLQYMLTHKPSGWELVTNTDRFKQWVRSE